MPEPTQIVLASRPQGVVKPENFRFEQAPMPTLPPGGVVVRSLYLSLDPYMRSRMDDIKSYAPAVAIGGVMTGESVAEVIQSDHPGYVHGDIVLAPTGWRSHAAIDKPSLRKLDPAAAPITTGLGVLGMPGFTAYAGLTLIGKPKPGDTVVVAAASGPVGSLVGQLGKMAGAHVVGIAGGADKCAYVKDELGFDAVIDHRASDFPAQLAAACPKGIDVYFENVGGAVWQAVLPLLNRFARVPVCGIIANYNGSEKVAGANLLEATMAAILRPQPAGPRLHQLRIRRRALPRLPHHRRPRHRQRHDPLPRGHHRRPGKRPRRLYRHAEGRQFRQGAGEDRLTMLKPAIPNLFVQDFPASLAYYTGPLGFHTLFAYGTPPFYAHIARDAATLALRHTDRPALDHGAGGDLLSAFIEVTDVDALYAEFSQASAHIHQAPRDEPWGMRSLIIADPAGNLICFASNGVQTA